MVKASTVALATVSTLALVGIGYALYFDQKRRNDPAFRRKLRKERKKLVKAAKTKEEIDKSEAVNSINAALDAISNETFPVSVEEKEKYFMEQVAKGETLFAQGEAGFQDAAICFFRALKVYPSPVELVMIYQKTVPEPVFNLVMAMMSLDVKRKQERYYEVFPPAEMNVKIGEISTGKTEDGKQVIRRALVADKDFSAGDILFEEDPVVSGLLPKLEGQDFCNFCLKQISSGEAVHCKNCDTVVFCSSTCHKTAADQYHQYLCPGKDDIDTKEHAFLDYASENNVKYPTMIARFLATMVYEETTKTPTGKDDEYNTWDHIERLRYLEVQASDKEKKEIELLKGLLGPKVPGIDEFVTEERYLTLKGKLLYNAYGVQTIATGDKEFEASSEDCRELPNGKSVGTALYRAASYLYKASSPNIKVTFPSRTHRLTVTATKAISKGDELTVSYNEDIKKSDVKEPEEEKNDEAVEIDVEQVEIEQTQDGGIEATITQETIVVSKE
ncbi:hypothetical protein BZG36_04940 [Bifiguratus adelaidae]|uniref:Mitochondrial import receptor subunit TOM20 n=1 Tax=Bifiguratus adelaidae TaxID=1938954 RepID=A0A261XTZ9_9FUNG|nr:hypothetical protein BZG36_04940 [Bifiguratus adelaidae]